MKLENDRDVLTALLGGYHLEVVYDGKNAECEWWMEGDRVKRSECLFNTIPNYWPNLRVKE